MSKATQFVPLELNLIDEGEFLREANFNLAKLQESLRHFRREHGEKSVGAKGKLVMEVVLSCEKSGDDVFGIKTQNKITLPTAPPSITVAIAGENQDGTPCLFVRQTGSSFDSPKQGIMATHDGEIVDPSKS